MPDTIPNIDDVLFDRLHEDVTGSTRPLPRDTALTADEKYILHAALDMLRGFKPDPLDIEPSKYVAALYSLYCRTK